MRTLRSRWQQLGDSDRVLQVVQPALIGLIDGTLSTLAPMFTAAFHNGSAAGLRVGGAAALAAAISMGISEGLSDDGELTGRGTALARGLIVGVFTALGGAFHALPFLIGDFHTAVALSLCVVAFELVAICWIRRRFLGAPLSKSLVHVVAAGAVISVVGIALGAS